MCCGIIWCYIEDTSISEIHENRKWFFFYFIGHSELCLTVSYTYVLMSFEGSSRFVKWTNAVILLDIKTVSCPHTLAVSNIVRVF